MENLKVFRQQLIKIRKKSLVKSIRKKTNFLYKDPHTKERHRKILLLAHGGIIQLSIMEHKLAQVLVEL